MAEITNTPPRAVYRNINLTDIRTYRMPVAALVSILHRISGAFIFVLLPFVIWLFDNSLSSEVSFAKFTTAFGPGIGVFPGWFIKLVTLVLMWAYLHHFIAGLRHVWMDVSHAATSKQAGRASAVTVLVLSLLLTVILGAKLFGLY